MSYCLTHSIPKYCHLWSHSINPVIEPRLRIIGLSGVAKLGHTGARALATGGCAPPVQALLPNVPLSRIANWALKVRKGVEIELRSLAICIFRITRSVCSLDLDVDYGTTVTLRCARRFVAKALSKCSNSRRRYGLK